MSKGCILITGGLGFIGSHTAVELVESGYDIVIIDNLSNCELFILDGITSIIGYKPKFYQINSCDKKELQKVFEENKIDAVIHFAAYKYVGESVADPLKYYENNILSLMSVLEAMRKYNCKYIVFSSSATVYGNPKSLPISEKSELQTPECPYGHTKIICEQIIKDSVLAYPELKAIIVRYFNPIGAHPSSNIGELPTGKITNLVPFITQTAAGVRDCLTVFGNDYETPDGTCVRDYIDICDLSNAHVASVSRALEGKMTEGFEVYNIGTGQGLSVKQIIDIFEKVSGVKLNYKYGPRRDGDLPCFYSDCKKANEVLGWEAKADIEQTILNQWNWEKKVRNIK